MNEALEKYARDTLKEGLSKCTEEELILFKRMYAPLVSGANINDVVDKMEVDKLDWAMQQVQRTLDKK